MPERQDLIVIDNGIIDRLLTDQRVLAAIPSLRNPATVPGRQTCCGSTSAIDYAAIKMTLAGLPSNAANVIKEVLNARQLRFYRPTVHKGKPATVKVTR